MSIDKKLLEILCCPVTKIAVKSLPKAKLQALNASIAQGAIRYADGSSVDEALDEGLITENETTIYRVDDDIPIMLEDRGIPTSQLQDS